MGAKREEGEKKAVRPGMQFVHAGVLMEAVNPSNAVGDDWWCKNPKEDVGLWRYSKNTILNNLVAPASASGA